MSFSISFVVHGNAVAFARAGAMGKRRFTPTPQRNYMAAIAMHAANAMGDMPPVDGPVFLEMRIEYLVPPSWSKKKAAAATWKTSAPDADNLAKIAKDAMSKIVYRDDAQVAWILVKKVYGPQARSTITITELGARVE
jgi:Holliday junction resolvase RusA-like endonuclease